MNKKYKFDDKGSLYIQDEFEKFCIVNFTPDTCGAKLDKSCGQIKFYVCMLNSENNPYRTNIGSAEEPVEGFEGLLEYLHDKHPDQFI